MIRTPLRRRAFKMTPRALRRPVPERVVYQTDFRGLRQVGVTLMAQSLAATVARSVGTSPELAGLGVASLLMNLPSGRKSRKRRR